MALTKSPTLSSPKQPMETSQTATLHTALTNAQGDRDAAAAHLGITREAINEAIRTTPELKALWTRTTELPLADAVDRNRMSFDLEDITPKQAAIADGFARQETKLQRFDWEGLGVTDPGTTPSTSISRSGLPKDRRFAPIR